MRWTALAGGLLLLAGTLVDMFRTLVIPRAARGRFRLTRLLFFAAWRPLEWLAVRRRTLSGRERMLAAMAPGFLFLLLAAWAFLIVLAYALIFWSPAFIEGIEAGAGDTGFGTVLYFSGSSLFTIGFGDVVPTGIARVVSVAEGATGLGLIAVVIAYLPVLYGAFNRREVGILLLDARAGSPPSGPELLRRVGGRGLRTTLPELFAEWERWAADVLETHLSYPLLAFFRSPHDNTSWVTSLGAVLDAATLVLAAVDEEPDEAVEMLYATASHAVEDLFIYFRRPEHGSVIGLEEFREVLEDLAKVGYPLRPEEEAWSRFLSLRGTYGGRLDALATFIGSPPGQWIGDRSSLPAGPTHDEAQAPDLPS